MLNWIVQQLWCMFAIFWSSVLSFFCQALVLHGFLFVLTIKIHDNRSICCFGFAHASVFMHTTFHFVCSGEGFVSSLCPGIFFHIFQFGVRCCCSLCCSKCFSCLPWLLPLPVSGSLCLAGFTPVWCSAFVMVDLFVKHCDMWQSVSHCVSCLHHVLFEFALLLAFQVSAVWLWWLSCGDFEQAPFVLVSFHTCCAVQINMFSTLMCRDSNLYFFGLGDHKEFMVMWNRWCQAEQGLSDQHVWLCFNMCVVSDLRRGYMCRWFCFYVVLYVVFFIHVVFKMCLFVM